MLAIGEQVLMQTATTMVANNKGTRVIQTRLCFDSGSRRSYITEDLANKLELKAKGHETLSVFTFGSKSAREIRTKVADLQIQLKNGDFFLHKSKYRSTDHWSHTPSTCKYSEARVSHQTSSG